MQITTSIIESDFCLPSSSTGRDVRRAFTARPDLLCIALVDAGQPIGLVSKSQLLLRYADELGPALFDRRPATLLADLNPLIVEADDQGVNLLGAAENGSASQLVNGFIVVRGGRYLGVSSLLALLRAARAKADNLQFLYSELEDAHKKVLAAENAKTRFLATVTHELRTPLNAILGYAELIAEELGSGDTTLKDDVAKISTAGRHLLALINQVLDFSKLESDALRVDPEWFDVSSWTQEVVDVVRPLATQNNNTLTLSLEAGMSPVCTDADRLRQCLFNLVGNACKFTHDGLITVSIFQRDGMLHAKVSDTGIGMSAEHMARLFLPFSQADASISRRYGGTGLGLSITQKIVHQLGGRVAVDSKLGVGSTFELVVPISLTDSEAHRDEALMRVESNAA